MNKPVVTRFAPSPTGSLHIGGARTALYSWAFARRHGGRFILRIEDTDQTRSSAQSTRGILSDLQWLGLDWDQGPSPSAADPYSRDSQLGEHGPYFQSQRLDIYREHVDRLLEQGLAYHDDQAVRFRMDRDVTFADEVYGQIRVAADQLEDFVILKRDGFPTFHMAVVVDDALMQVTHVIRGQEHLSNTAKHVALLDALGFDRPVFAHTPSIMNPDGSKMSKRDKAKTARVAAQAWLQQHNQNADDLAAACVACLKQAGQPVADDLQGLIAGLVNKENDTVAAANALAALLDLTLPEIDVADFRQAGYLPWPLLNYLSLLGWNPGNDVEQFDRDFLVVNFSLQRINKANSRFDRQKLLSFNADALAGLPAEQFAALLREHLPDAASQLGDRFDRFAAAYQPRARTLGEPAELGRFFLLSDDQIRFDEKAADKNLLKNERDGLKVLRELIPVLEQLADWQPQSIEQAIKQFASDTGRGMGKVAQPLRVAVTGSTVSPSIGDTLVILGRDATLARIGRCLTEFPDPQSADG